MAQTRASAGFPSRFSVKVVSAGLASTAALERAALLLDTVLAGADRWEVLHRSEQNFSVL